MKYTNGILVCASLVCASMMSASGMAASCPEQDFDTNVDNVDFKQLMDCINDLKGARIPPGTVAAFALPSCPQGWSSFKEAGGRFIVGAGEHIEGGNKDENGNPLPRYDITFVQRLPRYQTGGEEKHMLTIEEMPKHRHSFSHLKRETDSDRGTYASNWRIDKTAIAQTSEVGGSTPHNNMPSYIALYFCKKD